MTLGKQCYVACGWGTNGLLASIEILRLGVKAWVLIEIPELSPRVLPIYSQVDAENIVILGGMFSGALRYSD